MSATPRIERLRQNYINSKPSICYERAKFFTDSHKKQRDNPSLFAVPRLFMTSALALMFKFLKTSSSSAPRGNFAEQVF